MFRWLRPLLAVGARRAAPPTEPCRFRPSLECLGDRALLSAGLGELARAAVVHGWPTPALVSHLDEIGAEIRVAGPGLHLGEIRREEHAGEALDPVDGSVTIPRGVARGLERIGRADEGTEARTASAQAISSALDRGAERAPADRPSTNVPRGHPDETHGGGPEADTPPAAGPVRIEMRELVPVDRVAAEILDRLDHHFAAPSPEEAAAPAIGPDSHVRMLSSSADDTAVLHLAIASELPGDARLIPSPGRSDPAVWLRATAAATSARDPVPAAGGPGPGTPAPPAAPIAPEQSAEGETAGGTEVARFISQFLPFDTAGLRDEVNDFLRGLEPVILPASGDLLDAGWESIAAILAGAGAALAVGKFGPVFWRRRKKWWAYARAGNAAPTGPTPVRSPRGPAPTPDLGSDRPPPVD